MFSGKKIFGLDIGSHSVQLVAAQPDKEGQLEILGAVAVGVEQAFAASFLIPAAISIFHCFQLRLCRLLNSFNYTMKIKAPNAFPRL